MMLSKRLAIAAWTLCLAASPETRTEDAKPPRAATAVVAPNRDELRRVRVYRLHHADAASLVKELSGVLDSRRLRLVAYKPNNSMIVLGPSDVQDTMADLIGRLDAPISENTARPAGSTADSKPSRTSPANASAPADSQEETVKVIRVPSRDLAALAKALSAVAELRGSSVRTVIVTPPAEQSPTSQANRPTETRQR